MPSNELKREDFEKISAVVDPWIEEHGPIAGLMVVAEKMPHWQNFGSLLRHLQFVNSHHKHVKKVAIVADGVLADVFPQIAKHFVDPDIKQFKSGHVTDAREWLHQ